MYLLDYTKANKYIYIIDQVNVVIRVSSIRGFVSFFTWSIYCLSSTILRPIYSLCFYFSSIHSPFYFCCRFFDFLKNIITIHYNHLLYLHLFDSLYTLLHSSFFHLDSSLDIYTSRNSYFTNISSTPVQLSFERAYNITTCPCRESLENLLNDYRFVLNDTFSKLERRKFISRIEISGSRWFAIQACNLMLVREYSSCCRGGWQGEEGEGGGRGQTGSVWRLDRSYNIA